VQNYVFVDKKYFFAEKVLNKIKMYLFLHPEK